MSLLDNYINHSIVFQTSFLKKWLLFFYIGIIFLKGNNWLYF